MADPEAGESFKVTDRRRRPEDEPLPTQARDAEVSGSRPIPAGTEEPSPTAASDEGSLVGLFVMLGSTAAVALGAPDPVTGESHHDPPQAADMIDLLALLRKRTEGNRTLEETQVLDELIYDLQLRYVEVMKRFG